MKNTIRELIEFTHDLDESLLNQVVVNVTSDSREVVPGSVFVAIRGTANDGHQFLDSVENQGAILILGEQPKPQTLTVPYLQVSDGRATLARLAAAFYGNPSESMLCIAVTGTSGKTTTTYLIESILLASGHQVGVLGTVNFRFGSQIFPSTHTTPGAVELQHLLSMMKSAGCTAVVMEVSSHALKQKRVDSIAFDGMVFTNLSPEHLDFHPDMEDYFQSKSILFKELTAFAIQKAKQPVAVINSEDPYGKRLIQELGSSQKASQIFEFQQGETLQSSLQGIHGEVNGILIQSPLTGQFNCSNIAAAVTLAQALKLNPRLIEKGIANLPGVPGRLERVENDHGVHVWVDYAHKPDALEKVIQSLAEIQGNHQLITVFGCGGDRDRKKRPMMGKAAVEGSDYVFITSDNPRTEDPMVIIKEILEGTQGHQNFTVEVDRAQAIYKAIQLAKSGDLVLIAGKGHEDYQILGTKKIHFDDREVVVHAFSLQNSGKA